MLVYFAPCLLGDSARGMFARCRRRSTVWPIVPLRIVGVDPIWHRLARPRQDRTLMFTGIMQAVGRIATAQAMADGLKLTLDAGTLDLSDLGVGDSVAVSGCCLTIVAIDQTKLAFDVSPETLRCTARLDRPGPINLEKALRLSERLGGHLVAGNDDGAGIDALRARGLMARTSS
jgi:hypothetical protein